MSKEYGFTKLSEVEVTSELKDGDVILVVQDGAVKRYTGKVGSASVCVIELTQDDMTMQDELAIISHTFYDIVLNAFNKNERILFKMSMGDVSLRQDAVSLCPANTLGLPDGFLLFTLSLEPMILYVPKEEYIPEESPVEPT